MNLKTAFSILAAGFPLLFFAQETPKCVWEFGKDKIAPADITGNLNINGNSFFLDGTNVLRLPAKALRNRDYTIEFEMKAQNRRDINLINAVRKTDLRQHFIDLTPMSVCRLDFPVYRCDHVIAQRMVHELVLFFKFFFIFRLKIFSASLQNFVVNFIVMFYT